MSLRRSKIPKFIPIISLLILLVLGPIVFSFLQNASGVEAAWVDDNFSYRNAIPITSHTAAENNVYISATIDTSASGQFQSDCGDLRFTTVGGDILPYYIVSGCVSASTVVHVFFKSMPAGAQTIYYYYGNPSATNGYASADFATQASSYAVGSIGSQEKGGAPIAYWKFDEGTGTTTKDSSSNGKNGTISGATWKTESECLSGKCLYFDGNDTVTNSSFGFIPTTGTISLWQKTPFAWADATGGDLWLAQIRNSDTTSYIAFQNYTPGDSLQFKYYYSSTYQTNQGITPAFSAASWHHITMTFEANSVKLYVDGVLRSTDTSATMLGSALDYLVAGYQYTGYIDELKVYNYVQSLAQIKSDFKSRGTAKGTSVGLGSKISDLGSLSNGLVGYWKMDEVSGAGSTLADSSGNSNTGTAVLWGGGNTSTDSAHVAGKFGNSFSFDGGDDAITIPDATSLRFTSATGVSVSAWVKMNATNQNDDIVSKMSGNNGIQLRRNSSGKFTWAIGNGTTSSTATNTSSLSTGTWYHVTGTFDRNTLYVYVNGVQEGSNTISGFSDDTAQLVIGNENQLSNNAYWDGTIDEVRIYNRALSPREVRDLYNWAPGPMGYWNLDESTAGNANDSSGNGYTGTNTSTAIVNGKFDKARDFNGSTSILTTNITTNFPTSFTVEAWANADVTNATYDTIISKFTGSPSYNGFFLRHINGSMQAAVYSGGTGYTSTTPVTLGLWTHWAMSYDGTTVKLYKNGILSDSDPGTLGTNTSALIIGGNYGGATEPFDGKIDDVRLYNYARTQKQIVEDMNAGHPVGGSPVGSQVAYYKFDEGYGSTTNNSGSGTGINGTITGASWNNNGKFNKALQFVNGSNTWVVIPSDASLRFGSGGMTLSAWIKTSATGITQNIIRKDNGAGLNGYILRIETDNRLRISFLDGTGGQTTYATAGLVTDGVWHHVAATLDRTLAKQYLFVDGKQVNSTSTTLSDDNVSYTVKIGGTVASEALTGLIDEVKIYNSALTEDEIKLDYNRGQAMVLGTTGDASSSAGALYCQPGSSDTCNPPVGEWNFNENGGASTYDTSGNGNTCTLTNSPTWVMGKVGTAIQYASPTNNYLDCGNNSSLTVGTNDFTISAWLNPTLWVTNQEYSYVYRTKDVGSDNGYEFELSTWGQSTDKFVVCGYTLDTTSPGYRTMGCSNFTVNKNAWSYVTVVRQGTTTTWYLNGIKYDTDTNAGTGTNFNSATNFMIGKAAWGVQQFQGIIDQVRVFNYARTAAQIALDYNQGKPVGHWKLDECQGASVFDSSGNNNTGTITIGATGTQTAVGTCTTSGTAWYNGVTGKFNSSLNFDGTDDYVSVADPGTNSILDLTNSVTLSTWVNPASMPQVSNAGISGKGNNYFMLFPDGQQVRAYFWNGSTHQSITTTNANISATNWNHIVMVYEPANFKIYVNGVQKANSASISDSMAADNSVFVVGSDRLIASRYFNGQIDDVRIYNYALTATQVKSLFNGGAAVKFAPLTGSP